MTHFKTRPNSYAVGEALTGRARCRACRQLVGRGELRFVTHAFVRPGRATTFTRHVRCADAAFMRAVLAVHGDLGQLPVRGGDEADVLSRVRGELRLSPDGSTNRNDGDPGAATPESIRDCLQRSAALSSPSSLTISRNARPSNGLTDSRT